MGYIVSRDSLNFGYVSRENTKNLPWIAREKILFNVSEHFKDLPLI